jgi:MtN3 and saliva related transmembrane protein
MTLLGLLSGVCTTISFLPQVVRTFRTASAGDISWGWLLLFAAGVTGWLTYGILRGDLPITVTNTGTLTLVLALVVLKGTSAARA